MELDFSTFYLVVDSNNFPTHATFEPLSEREPDSFEFHDAHYRITKKKVRDRYLWFYFEYGKAFPRGQLLDIKTKEEKDNPRSESEVELAKQLFGLYDILEGTLYLSDRRKKPLFEEYLSARLSREVTVKTFFKNPEAFIKAIKTVEEVKFTAKRNLFNLKDGLRQCLPEPVNFFGLGDEPKEYILKAVFNRASKTPEFVKKFIDWYRGKVDGKTDRLVCIGRNDKNMEMVFNADTFTYKVPIYPTKTEQGLFDPDEVAGFLINKIESNANENLS